MGILGRYILKEHFSPFIYSLSLIVFLFILNFAFQILGKILGKGLPVGIILEFFVYNIAWILAMAVPMATLIATLMAFGRLAGDHEITALKAGGVSLWRVTWPLLMAGLLLCVSLIAYNNWVLPEFNYKSNLLRRSIFRKAPTMQMEEGLFMFDVPNMVVHSRGIDHETRRMSEVTIFDDTERGVHSTILADSADLGFNEDWAEFALTLYHGQIHRRDWRSPLRYTTLDYDSSELRIEAKNMVLDRQETKYRNDREQTISQMMARIIRWEERDPERNGRKIRSYWVEIHKKLSLPVAILVFILIGVPLGVKSGKGGIGVSGSLSVLFFLIYWIFLIGGEDLADNAVIPFITPGVAMWAPNVLLGLVGLWLMRSAIREGTPLQLPARITAIFQKRKPREEADADNQAMADLARALQEENEEEGK
jgi:lipopolysaccharide export system permease protein